jgi:hypothetical protein
VAFDVPIAGGGQTTWKRPDLVRGLEADDSFYFRPEKSPIVAEARKRRSLDIADYPNPDMAVEVDISPPAVDRENICKKLQVAEIWYFDGNEVRDCRIPRTDAGSEVDSLSSATVAVAAGQHQGV